MRHLTRPVLYMLLLLGAGLIAEEPAQDPALESAKPATKEPRWPKDAFALPGGIADHVIFDQTTTEGEAPAYRRPVIFDFSGSEYRSWDVYSADLIELTDATILTVLGLPKDAETLTPLYEGMLAHTVAQAGAWRVNPNAIFLVMPGEGHWEDAAAFTKAHPDHVAGWLVSAGHWKEHPYPTEAPPAGTIIGFTSMGPPSKSWQPFLDACFANGCLVYDIPVMEEGDTYFLSAKHREKRLTALGWMHYAWYLWRAEPAERSAYFARMLPEAKTSRRILKGKVVAPNVEALAYLESLMFYPGINAVPWYGDLAAHRLPLIAADHAFLKEHDEGLQAYRSALQLLDDSSWKRANKDIARALDDEIEAFEKTKDKDLKAHLKSYEIFSTGYTSLWDQADRQGKLADFQPAFEKVFAAFPQQKGGHEARDLAWRIASFANGQWQEKLRMPKPRD